MGMFSGFGSILKGIGKAGMNMVESSKIAKDFSNTRQSTINPWYNAKNQPGMKNKSDAPMPGSSVGQDA